MTSDKGTSRSAPHLDQYEVGLLSERDRLMRLADALLKDDRPAAARKTVSQADDIVRMILTRRKELSLENGIDNQLNILLQLEKKVASIGQELSELQTMDSPAEVKSKPPMLAELITRAITKPKLVDRVLDARSEKFDKHVVQRDLNTARCFYWIDTIKSTWPALKGLARWMIAGEFMRRWLGS